MPKRKLDECMGRTWMYRTNNYRFLSYNDGGKRITIATDKKWLEVESAELQKFLDEILPVEGDKELTRKEDVDLIEARTLKNNVTDLTDILKDNIKRIKEDPSYAKQAKEVTSSARTIIELARLELEAHREIQKSRGK